MAENEEQEQELSPLDGVTCPECGHVFPQPAAHDVVRQPGVDGPYLDDVRKQQEEAYRKFKNEKDTGLVEVGVSGDSPINSHTDADGNKLEEVTNLPKTDLEQHAAAKNEESSKDGESVTRTSSTKTSNKDKSK